MEEIKRLKYDEAVQLTINRSSPFFGSLFQKIIVVCAISSIMTGFVILGGISFLEKVPNRFECRSDSLDVITERNNDMTHVSAPGDHPEWEKVKP